MSKSKKIETEKLEDGTTIVVRKPLSAKHEKFCIEYCKLLHANLAYCAVYPNSAYNSSFGNSSRLLKKPRIQERIAEIQEKFAATVKQDKNKTVSDLLETAEQARADGRYGDYAKLRDMVIKMCGFYEAEKVDVDIKGFTLNYIKPKKD